MLTKERLSSIFQQFGKEEKLAMPDNLKDAVFSTLDAASLLADIVDLFTVKFIQSQAELLDTIPDSEYGNEQQMLYDYYVRKFEEK